MRSALLLSPRPSDHDPDFQRRVGKKVRPESLAHSHGTKPVPNRYGCNFVTAFQPEPDRFKRSPTDYRNKLALTALNGQIVIDYEITIGDIGRLFPRVRAEVLRALFGGSRKQRRYVRELMRETGLALSTVQDELRKLNAIGLVTSYSDGLHRFYLAKGGHPVVAYLRGIVKISDQFPRWERAALFGKERSGNRKLRRHSGKANVSGFKRGGPNWGLFSTHGTT